MFVRMIYSDPQDTPARCFCKCCGAELYRYDDDDYCPQCLESMEEE